MIVRLVKNWDFPNVKSLMPDYLDDPNFFITEEPIKKCDLLLVFNSSPKDISVQCRSSFLFLQEPPVEQYLWHKEYFKYYDKVFGFWEENIPLQTSLPWHLKKSFDELISKDFEKELLENKKNVVSWVTSTLNCKPGHKFRMELLQSLKNDPRFIIRGRGINEIKDKLDIMKDSKYSLCIENYSTKGYFTEKIVDAILSLNLPFYWGATDILDYFPSEAVITLTGEIDEDLSIISKALKNGEWEKRLLAIKKAREVYLNEYSLKPWIKKLASDYRVMSLPMKKTKITGYQENSWWKRLF